MALDDLSISSPVDAEGSDKLTDWKQEPSLPTLKGDIEKAKPSHDAKVASLNHWRDLFHVRGSAKPPKIKGRSQVQPRLIRKQAEWRYAPLSEPFLNSDKLFNINPVTFEDADAAQQNELVLNWQFRTKLNMVNLIDNYIRAVVDEGHCILRTGWVRETVKIEKQVPLYEYYPLEDPQALQQLQQAVQQKQQNPRGFDESASEELKESVNYFEETQQPVMAVVSGMTTQTVDHPIKNQPTVSVPDPENIIIDPSCNGDIDNALFVVEMYEVSKAELEANSSRYKNLNKINWEDANAANEPDYATNTPSEFQFKDKSRRKAVAYDYWGFYDINGDGVLKPIVATWVGNTLIRMEENPYPDGKVPFVHVAYMPKLRDLGGEPDAQLLEDNQKIVGAVTRGMIDSLGKSANSQTGIAKGTLDPLNRRRFENGQDYEFNGNQPPQNAIYQHVYPELPASAGNMVQMQNQEAEALTGIRAFQSNQGGGSLGEVPEQVQNQIDAAGKREMSILRRLAQGMEQIGRKIIAMNGAFLSEQEVVRVTNKEFVTVKREDLKGDFDLEVDISTAEIDNQKAQDLGFIIQTMGPNMDPDLSKKILAKIMKLKRMPDLAEELINYQPQPDPMQQQNQQLELQKLQAEIQELQSKVQLNQAKAQESQSNTDQKNLDYVEQETGTKHARDMQKQQAQAQGNQDLEVTKSLLQGRKEGETKPNIAEAIGYNQLSQNSHPGQASGF